MAEEILEIADDGTNDWMMRQGENGVALEPIVDHEHISRSKLRVDARKWLMAKMQPKKYGDYVRQDVSVNTDMAERLVKARERVKSSD